MVIEFLRWALPISSIGLAGIVIFFMFYKNDTYDK